MGGNLCEVTTKYYGYSTKVQLLILWIYLTQFKVYFQLWFYEANFINKKVSYFLQLPLYYCQFLSFQSFYFLTQILSIECIVDAYMLENNSCEI